MPVFPKICKLLINISMRFVKNECLTPHLSAFIIVFFLTLSGAAHADRSEFPKTWQRRQTCQRLIPLYNASHKPYYNNEPESIS